MSERSSVVNFKTLVLTIFVFTTVWLIFTEFDFNSLIIGIFFVSIAVAMNLWLRNFDKQQGNIQPSIRLLVVPKFLLFFIIQSIIGGLDTAKRAVSPSLEIVPSFIKYQMRFLSIGVNSNLFINLVSLLPGSLIVLQEDDGILVHVLSQNQAIQEDIAKCERIVADLYGIDSSSDVEVSKLEL